MSTVLTDVDGRIGWITLNRPDALNAITLELALALEQALGAVAPQVDVIVITGAGRHFCVGGDFKALEELRAAGRDAMAGLFAAFGRATALIGELDVPVVCAVHGYAMAGGFELAQACDVVLVAEDAQLCDNHSNFGQVPGGGGSQYLPRLVGRQRASAHILTGDRLSGVEAERWGLAYRAVPAADLRATAQQLAEQLAGKSREAQAKVKRLIRDGLHGPLPDGLAREREVVVDHLTGEAAAEGIASFTNRS